MQAQIQRTSKKNKVTVPFYSPPCRFYEQTSADIIKEARAAIITTSSVDIKPVLTNRPFTPNQTERTLFGNLKKNECRPPSSFSLRHLKNEELSSRVKLPSIDIVPRRKNSSTLQYSKNLSLDNLIEDYDAEVFEEIKLVDAEKLPIWKKSHSCPKEGKLSKVASLNDICHSCNNENSFKEDENSELHKKGNLESDKYHFEVSQLFGDSVKTDRGVIYSQELLQYSGLSKDGNYHKLPETTEDELMASNDKRLVAKTIMETSLVMSDVGVKFEPKNNQNKTQVIERETELNKSNKKEVKEIFLEQDLNDKKSDPEEKVVYIKNEPEGFQITKRFSENENIAEKSMITWSKSEYLTCFKAGYRNFEIIKQSDSVPLEILELHEMARYYGVNVDENDSGASGMVTNSMDNSTLKATEKPNSDSHLKELIGMNEEKEKEKYKDTCVIKSQNKVLSQETSDNVEFFINNKKQYQVFGNKGITKEKTYEQWNSRNESDEAAIQQNVLNDNWDLFWKNSYYRDKEEKDEENQQDIDRESLQQLVSKIVVLIKKGAENQKIKKSISQLYGLIKNNKVVLDSKSKENISRALYLYVDNENPEVLLSLAKIFFLLKEENFLSVACKIIFKVSRSDANDHLFLDEEDVLELFLEGIGRASPLDCADSCIYSYGALKFLTLNHSILSRILHMGALDLMALHLKMINNAYDENGKVNEQTQHALFQLTGALRHVAAGEGALSLFLTTNCVNILCKTLKCFYKDEDVIVNISRTLSLLSTDQIIIQALMQIEGILTTLTDLIDRYRENDKILIRLAYCLGNIVEHSDLARVQLSRNDASLTVLLNVLKFYIDKDLEISLEETYSPELEVIDDVIVKVIRIIANMSMNPIVGSNLSPATKKKKSLQLSKLLSVLLMRKDPGITLLATLGCLNNISYYCNTHSMLIDITQGIERVLGLESVECQIEAARVLGNLTRHREIRDLIYSTGGVDLLSKLLSSPEQEVVRCACGALVNMMLDLKIRKSFVKAQGIDKLIKAMEVFPNDWSLASLVARAIWNSCGDDMSSAVAHNNMEHLLNILVSFLEEENWNDGDIAWEEFASVATDLLEKISSHLEST